MTQSSFYADGETYDTAVVESNDQPGSTDTTQAPSGFYPDGGIYMTLTSEDILLAELNAIKADAIAQTNAIEALAAADAAAALTSANNSHTSEVNAASSASASATSATNAAAVVQAAAGTATPLIDGTAAVGTGTKWAREDHKHPTDTTRAPTASPSFTGNITATSGGINLTAAAAFIEIGALGAVNTPFIDFHSSATNNNYDVRLLVSGGTASVGQADLQIVAATVSIPTPAVNDNSTKAASTAYVIGQASASTPVMNGTGAVGTGTKWSREDHVHPSDTSRAPLASPTFTGTVTAPALNIGANSLTIGGNVSISGGLSITPSASGIGIWSGGNLSSVASSGTGSVALVGSPAFTGTPTAPTASPGDNSTTIATTAFVQAAASSPPLMPKAWGYWSNSGTTYTLVKSSNVASITRNSAGNITITFTSGAPSAAFVMFANADSQTFNATSFPGTSTTGQIRITNLSGTASDAGFSFVAFW